MTIAGRKTLLNWTECLGQFTCTIRGKRYRLGTDKSKAEADFNRLMADDGQAERKIDPNPLLTELVNSWLNHVLKKHSPKRFRLVKARMESFVLFLGVGTRVRDLRPQHLAAWLAPLNLKPGSERLYKAMVLSCLNWAAKGVEMGGGGMLLANPIRGKIKLPEGHSRGGDAVWPEKVYRQVLAHCSPAFADVIKVLRFTGCRPNLVCKVEARHFNPITKTWDVADLYDQESRKAIKRVWLSPQAIDIVQRLNGQYPEGPIFRNTLGGQWQEQSLQTYLKGMMERFTATKELSWPTGLCIYGLRHTFATDFLRQFPDKIEYLRELLGHKDLKMIRKHYGHLFDEHAAMHGVLAGLQMPC